MAEGKKPTARQSLSVVCEIQLLLQPCWFRGSLTRCPCRDLLPYLGYICEAAHIPTACMEVSAHSPPAPRVSTSLSTTNRQWPHRPYPTVTS